MTGHDDDLPTRLMRAVDGASWIRWDDRTNRLFVWHQQDTLVRVYDTATGAEQETWPVTLDADVWPPSVDVYAAQQTVAERLNAGY